MSLKDIFGYPFKNWFQPVLFNFVALPIFLISIAINVGIIQVIGLGLFSIGIIWLIASMIFLLFKREWKKSFATLLILFAIVIAFGLMQ